MKYRIAKTLEEWARVQSLGTYEQDFKDGSLWSFGMLVLGILGTFIGGFA